MTPGQLATREIIAELRAMQVERWQEGLFLDTAANRLEALERALRALVGEGAPDAASDDQCSFCLYCEWKGEYFEEPQHDADCPILQARALVGGEQGQA